MTGRDGPCFGRNMSEMLAGQQQQQLVTAESLNQMRQYKAHLEREIQRITTELEQSTHVSYQQGEGQSVMLPLITGHQSLHDEQFQQQTDRSRHHDNDQRNSQSVGQFETGRENNQRHERRMVVGFRSQSQLARRNPNDRHFIKCEHF